MAGFYIPESICGPRGPYTGILELLGSLQGKKFCLIMRKNEFHFGGQFYFFSLVISASFIIEHLKKEE